MDDKKRRGERRRRRRKEEPGQAGRRKVSREGRDEIGGGEEPVRRDGDFGDTGDIERGGGGAGGANTDIERGAAPPGQEGHAREMEERRPHREP
jgi:hypothetical protein